MTLISVIVLPVGYFFHYKISVAEKWMYFVFVEFAYFLEEHIGTGLKIYTMANNKMS